MDSLDASAIASKYNSLNKIWDEEDKWHSWTFKRINQYISKVRKQYSNHYSLIILNAGSGGNSYGFDGETMFHIDIAEEKISTQKNYHVGTIELLPYADKYFDLIICVGSVINYCDPVKVISEFKRVLKTRGELIIEFENSNTLELIGKKTFNAKSVLTETFYNGKERIWYYSTNFIKEIISFNNLEVLDKQPIHILSPLLLRMSKNPNSIAWLGRLDGICKYIPGLKNTSSNTILRIRHSLIT